jgi:hypothetical protein
MLTGDKLSMLQSLRVFNQIPNRVASQKWFDHKPLNAFDSACIQSDPEQGNIQEKGFDQNSL